MAGSVAAEAVIVCTSHITISHGALTMDQIAHRGHSVSRCLIHSLWPPRASPAAATALERERLVSRSLNPRRPRALRHRHADLQMGRHVRGRPWGIRGGDEAARRAQ